MARLTRNDVQLGGKAGRGHPACRLLLDREGQLLLIGVDDEDRQQLAGCVSLAFSLTPWRSPGISEKLSPAL